VNFNFSFESLFMYRWRTVSCEKYGTDNRCEVSRKSKRVEL